MIECNYEDFVIKKFINLQCLFFIFKYHGSTIQNVREAVKIVSEQLGIPSYPVAIALDTKGPEIRTGLLVDVIIFFFTS